MSKLLSLSSAQLKRAAKIKDKIEDLNKELVNILGSTDAVESSATKPKRKMSAKARAKISAAQKKRWAKSKATDKKTV